MRLDQHVGVDVAVVGRKCQGRLLHALDAQLPKLDVYQRSIEFLALAVEATANLPRGNAALLDQLRRAATSIPLNIAEAAGRTGAADAARAYAIARGSAMECAAVLDALVVLKMVDPEIHRRAVEILARVVAMLTKLCR